MTAKVFTFLLVCAISEISWAIPDYATTTRPPSYPLAVRTPYANIWLPANELPGTWPCFWTGKDKGWTGLVRVDGVTYVYMGNPSGFQNRAKQTSAVITPTQTHFGITAGTVDLNVTFFSPVEYKDMMKQSIPLSHVFVSVKSNDGANHEVQLYMDITGEWATSDNSAVVTWTPSTTPEGLKVWSTQLQNPVLFAENDEYARWGEALIATSADATHGSGSDMEMRGTFNTSGALANNHDTNYRCAECDWPTFAFAHSLNSVVSGASVLYVVGHIREDNANFLGTPQQALWKDYWPTKSEMLDFFWSDVLRSLSTANELDIKILNDAFATGGQYYADILTLSLRQAYAGNEFSGNKTNPVLYQKEISSGGFMQTVDVIYPSGPMFYYLNVDYLRLLLEPLFLQMESQVWTKPFAMHDIGAPYPNALGQSYGFDMPIEESSNMIFMIGDIAFHPETPVNEAIEYVNKHWAIMEQWAEYLYHNCLYPVNQLTTDDFIGATELNSGLALKGILGMATFSKLAELIGNTNATTFYANAVQSYVTTWIQESMHVDGDHLKMEYNVTDGYQFKYNAYHDKLFNLNVIPEEIYEMEAAYYLTKLEPYGIPFVSTHDYTKTDWEMWTAAAFGEANPELKTGLIEGLGKFLRFTPQRVPFTDWHVTATSNRVGFQARPVAGGHFALLSLALAENSRK